ncbi:MAG TPA: DUF4973 domain-containing protein [Sphingobacterium sp.]|nr:DUF4973 domain-containing protein [Sphingobacterium sp.]
MMKNIYMLFLAVTGLIGFVSCNNEWEDEQYEQLVSFKAEPNTQGVAWTYVRYKPDGIVKFDLPIMISGSTPNTQDRVVRIGLDRDTLAMLNREQFGHREELFFRELPSSFYSMPETVTIPAGESLVTIPIEFSLANIDEVEKWVLPLQILEDPSGNYQVNPHKHYKRAMLRITPFNDYSGVYSGSLYKIFLEDDDNEALTINEHRAYVVDDETIFFYAGTRDVDFLDRKNYKVFVKFLADGQLEIWSDNVENNAFKINDQQPIYYTKEEEWDAVKPYLKHVYITLSFAYSFEDYTAIPGLRVKYSTEGMLSMQRDLNTLIPDEDQQVQW